MKSKLSFLAITIIFCACQKQTPQLSPVAKTPAQQTATLERLNVTGDLTLEEARSALENSLREDFIPADNTSDPVFIRLYESSAPVVQGATIKIHGNALESSNDFISSGINTTMTNENVYVKSLSVEVIYTTGPTALFRAHVTFSH